MTLFLSMQFCGQSFPEVRLILALILSQYLISAGTLNDDFWCGPPLLTSFPTMQNWMRSVHSAHQFLFRHLFLWFYGVNVFHTALSIRCIFLDPSYRWTLKKSLHAINIDNKIKANIAHIQGYLHFEKQSAVTVTHSKSNAWGIRRISVISIGFIFPKSMNCIVAKPSLITSTHSTRYHRPFLYFTTQISVRLRNVYFLVKI